MSLPPYSQPIERNVILAAGPIKQAWLRRNPDNLSEWYWFVRVFVKGGDVRLRARRVTFTGSGELSEPDGNGSPVAFFQTAGVLELFDWSEA